MASPSLRSGVPAETDDGWPIAAPAIVGLDSDRLESTLEWLHEFPPANIHGIVVVRRGVLAFEHYGRGYDEVWDRSVPDAIHGPTTRHDLRSVTKSIISLLFGIALDRRLVTDLDAPVFDFFPEHADLKMPDKAAMSLRHLLMMASGLEWNEYVPYLDPSNSERAMLRSDDRWRFALQPARVSAPGSVWNYSAGCTELLGAIISKVSGKTIEEFATEALFSPLGITDVGWGKYPDQIPSASSGLQMRPRDLAKLGQLVLQHGIWDDRRIVSDDWIDQSTTPQIGPADRLQFYGYHWWTGRSLIRRQEVQWIAADGLGGQRLFIVPAFDLVCVITAGHYDDPMQVWLPLMLFNRYVLAAVT